MPKILLDFFRWGWILGATGATVKWLSGFHWVLGVILALPVFIIMMNLIGFLTLPLYVYVSTPEAIAARKMLEELENENEKGGEK